MLIYMIDLMHESELGLGSDTMPLQLGLIAAYCLKKHGDKVSIEIFKSVEEFAENFYKRPPHIIASSNYIWNINLGYRFALLAKEEWPEIITVFGGPNYPEETEEQIDWLKQYPGIDFYIYEDGEVPFANLVGRLLEGLDAAAVKKMKLPSCHSLIDGKPYFGELEPRLTDLTVVPSPYLLGLMDKFFEHKLIPTIQTSRGCPFSCTFCTEGGEYYNRVFKTSTERKKAEVDYIIGKVRHTKTLRIVDSNFGMFEEDVKLCEYLSDTQRKFGYPEYFDCTAGKNRQERLLRCNELLGGAMRLTASVQSLAPEVLKEVKRTNISTQALIELSDRVSDTNTPSYSEIILGLPNDSLANEKKSMKGLVDVGINLITQHQLSLIHGTELNLRSSRVKYGIKSGFRPTQRCVGVYFWRGEKIPIVDIEEICIGNNTLSLQDYMEARRFYLTVGLFYNDRIFGGINALLRLSKIPASEWLERVHERSQQVQELKDLYGDFMADTRNELWENRNQLIADVTAEIERYTSGKAGGNIIYKYRVRAIFPLFQVIHFVAFRVLRECLAERGLELEEVVSDIERFTARQKGDLLDLDFDATESFSYDIIRLIQDISWVRKGGSLADLHYPVRFRFRHTEEQKQMITRQLNFYGTNLSGLTMLISRFPIKHFYRTVKAVD